MSISDKRKKELSDREKQRKADRAALRTLDGKSVKSHNRIRETEDHKRKHERCGVCLMCGEVSDKCICSGYMTEAAQERFYRSRE